MQRIENKDTNFTVVGFADGVLKVMFPRSRLVRTYYDVSPSTYQQLINADSPLEFFWHTIRVDNENSTEWPNVEAVLEDLSDDWFVLEARSVLINEEWSGFTPLQYMASQGDVSAVKLLINAGANVNLKEFAMDSTALQGAVASGRYRCARLLLEAGASKTDMDGNGSSAEKIAFWKGDESIIELLKSY